jgi:hypothetical protein
MAQRLDAPALTPAIKAKTGHDVNIPIDIMRRKLGIDVADRLGELTLQIFEFGHDKLKKTKIVLADTKLEFGFIGNEIISSRGAHTRQLAFLGSPLYQVGYLRRASTSSSYGLSGNDFMGQEFAPTPLAGRNSGKDREKLP